jgi:hypothetical protein
VPTAFKKRKQILSKVKAKYWQRTYKFGIRIPKTVTQAQEIDKENGDTLWWDANLMEMRNVRPAFNKWEKDESDLVVGYEKIKHNKIHSAMIASMTTHKRE